jgi:hypothetical protein
MTGLDRFIRTYSINRKQEVRTYVNRRRLMLVAAAAASLMLAVPGTALAATNGGTAAGGTRPSVFPKGVVLAGNVNNGPVHKVWTRSIPATACKAVRKANPKASCSITVTLDARIVNGPQKPPAGAQVATSATSAVPDSGYWTYEVGTETSRGAIWHATLREEVAYHDYCPRANCNPQGIDWNQWIDTSGYACISGCTISNIQRGVINNGAKLDSNPEQFLNGWEDFAVNCDISITGNSAGCNAGHGNRLYFNGDGGLGGYSY